MNIILLGIKRRPS